MRIAFIVTIFVLISSVAKAQISSAKLLSPTVELYKKAELQIQLKAEWTNPYLQEDIALDMHIQSPSGKQLVLPCFYESGKSGELSEWKANFAPQEIGTYNFYFKLSSKKKKPSSSKPQIVEVLASADKGFLTVNNNWTLKFDNNGLFRGIAENICWESRDQDDSKYFKELHERSDRYSYDFLLPDFAKNGGNFFRTWMCSWNLPIDFSSNFNNERYTASESYFNESAVARMDHLIHLADSLDLYIMLTLGTGDYRGKNPNDVKTSDDFFASPIAKQTYKNRLRYIVARWGFSPHIAMWEFLNEVDNIQFNGRETPIKTEDIVTWHQEMSAYLKELDPYNHIITTSISHRDIPGLNDISTIDINQKHIYNNTDILSKEINEYTQKHQKPYIIGEFGFEWDWQKNFDDFSHGMEVDFKRGLWYGIFSPTPVLPMSWWWEYFENRGMTAYFRGVREISDQMLDAGKGEFIPLEVQAGDLHAYALKCKDHIYIYVYNPTNRVQKQSVSLKVPYRFDTALALTQFEPTLLTYEDLGYIDFKDQQIVLDDIFIGSKKEMVYILKNK
ncbi:DUF5060 domain-containing protein [Sphingobacterium hungaricum]|uniref:Glycoside hydrolase n=1 Tax=Sphingobacterium hungaricum TaxID=2082723 RepID=A0A928YPF9_9SPHI|nr:DUF5060 domain-containing protein [Sphingobacterium hungaricum]MBE8712452.1 glycoside hydrolase [Sphingobacterium hungaricum]